ncbi:MAG: hypothetical protein MUE73_01505 [Planctomycetes bacterium]|jgi:hypothetical protein|nr:hypothetical protein [Planctomycetota bacterium]
MTCLDEGRWIDLAAGRLRFRARRRAIRHLEACTECRRRYAEARAFVAEGLPGLAAAEGLRPRDPSALRARVFAAVERDRGARRPHRATRVAVLLAPLAAALLVAAVLGYRFLGERGWKPRLEELDGAILVASGGEDLSRLENRQAELRPGDLVLALPGAQGRLHLRDQRSLDIIGPAVLVVDFARVHLLRGIALARAPAGVPLLASAGEYDLRILGSAEIDAFAPDPLPVLQAARRLAADIQRDARPGRAVAAAAPPNGLSELRVHSLHGEVAFGAGLPVVDGGLVLTVSSGGPWPTPLRGGREPFFRSGDLTPRELDAVKLLLLRSPDPLRSLALCATDAALESWRRALAVRLTGELGDPRARPWLTDLFKDPGVPVVVRAATITCLALLDDTSLLAAALRDAEPAVAEAAATIAARLPGQTGQLAAISADDSIPPLARAIAAWALERSSEKVAADLLLSIA